MPFLRNEFSQIFEELFYLLGVICKKFSYLSSNPELKNKAEDVLKINHNEKDLDSSTYSQACDLVLS